MFRLKKGMKFYDGREVTSKDVKATIDYIMNPANKSNFQISYSVWVGANNDPDVFDLVFSSKRIPPNGASREHHRNPWVDRLIDGIRMEMNQEKRKELCSEVQKILANDVPYVPLWFEDMTSVHRREIGEIALSPAGG